MKFSHYAAITAVTILQSTTASAQLDPKTLPSLGEVIAAGINSPKPPGWTNESELCTRDYSKADWNTYHINEYITYLSKKVKEQHADKSVQQYIISEVEDLATVKKYDACGVDSDCRGAASDALTSSCARNPSGTWVLQSYRYWNAFWKSVSTEVASQIGGTIDIKLRGFPGIFATGAGSYDWGAGEIDGEKTPDLVVCVLGSLSSLIPVPVFGATFGIIGGFVGARKSSPWSEDIDWRLYSNISQALSLLTDTYNDGFRGLMTLGDAPASSFPGTPDEFSKDPGQPHNLFVQDDWITSMPPVAKADWSGFYASVYAPFINYLWTKSDKHVMVARISPSIGMDPCVGENVVGANTKICDNGIAMALVAVNKKDVDRLHDYYAEKVMAEDDGNFVPGLTALPDYELSVSDVVRSSWRNQQLHGFEEAQPGANETMEDLKSFASQGVRSNERAKFTVPVCDIEQALTSKNVANSIQMCNTFYKDPAKNARCKFKYALRCGCPDQLYHGKPFPVPQDVCVGFINTK